MNKVDYKVIIENNAEAATNEMNSAAAAGYEFVSMSSHSDPPPYAQVESYAGSVIVILMKRTVQAGDIMA